MRLNRGVIASSPEPRLPRPSKALLEHLRERFGQSTPMPLSNSLDELIVSSQKQAEQRAKLEVISYLQSLSDGNED